MLWDYVNCEEAIALIVAVVLGGAIGLEREINGKPAGLRTNILICIGAAAFTIMAPYLSTSPEAVTRMAAGIITGVGFLGAGALIQEGTGIQGLTTAASIWLVTSIGIACGAGLYPLAVTITILALVVLLGMHPLTHMISKRAQKREKNGASEGD
jgi:putative Mg2+ transporter-C (MgtC) family protein